MAPNVPGLLTCVKHMSRRPKLLVPHLPALPAGKGASAPEAVTRCYAQFFRHRGKPRCFPTPLPSLTSATTDLRNHARTYGNTSMSASLLLNAPKFSCKQPR